MKDRIGHQGPGGLEIRIAKALLLRKIRCLPVQGVECVLMVDVALFDRHNV